MIASLGYIFKWLDAAQLVATRQAAPNVGCQNFPKEWSRKARVDELTPDEAMIALQRGVTSTIARCEADESIGFRTNSMWVSLSAT